VWASESSRSAYVKDACLRMPSRSPAAGDDTANTPGSARQHPAVSTLRTRTEPKPSGTEASVLQTAHARSHSMRHELSAGQAPARWLSGGDLPRVNLASRPPGRGRAVCNEDDIITLIRHAGRIGCKTLATPVRGLSSRESAAAEGKRAYAPGALIMMSTTTVAPDGLQVRTIPRRCVTDRAWFRSRGRA